MRRSSKDSFGKFAHFRQPYDEKGFMPVNKSNAYSFNNVTARKDNDGSVTIHFGGDPKADNFLQN